MAEQHLEYKHLIIAMMMATRRTCSDESHSIWLQHLLKFVFLQFQDAKQLIDWTLAVLQQYAQYGRRAHTGSAHCLNTRLQEEADAEAEAELRALLCILTHVTQRDLVDFGTSEGRPGIDVAQVLVQGHVLYA